jgi:hypothetical protein
VSLTSRVLKLALYCAGEELRARHAGKPPGVQAWNAEVVRALELEIAVSTSGQETGWETAGLNHDRFLTARESADIIGVDSRTVRRLAADLEGRLCGRQWMFPEAVVREYAEGLIDARDSA